MTIRGHGPTILPHVTRHGGPPLRRIAVLVIAMTALVAQVGAPAADARECSVRGKERKLGATYVFVLKARNVSCASAERLVKAYHACRRRNGGRDGRCGRVSGYRCTERRYAKISTQYSANAECKSGSKVVYHKYQQNL